MAFNSENAHHVDLLKYLFPEDSPSQAGEEPLTEAEVEYLDDLMARGFHGLSSVTKRPLAEIEAHLSPAGRKKLVAWLIAHDHKIALDKGSLVFSQEDLDEMVLYFYPVKIVRDGGGV